jgi:arylsulfatase A
MSPRTRREFLTAVGGFLAGTSLGGALGASGERRGDRPPNVLLILADDLGRECLGSYGGTSYATPALDALASSGMRFAHCYATPWCGPSRVELLTGKYGFRNYRAWGELGSGQEVTFAELLRGAGYATCITGKWQLCQFDDPANADHPRRAGFEEFCLWYGVVDDGSGGVRFSPKYWSPWVFENGRRRTGLEGRYGPDVFDEYLTDFFRRSKERPFLALHSLVLPHVPFEPTPHSGALERTLAMLPEPLRSRFAQRFFSDHLAYLDFGVGRILRALEDLGLRERTLVLFTSDNGTHAGIESRLGDRIVSGGKGRMTDAGMRVPLLASWPGSVPAGSVCDDLVDLSDFLPTLADLAGARLPEGGLLDGRSFLPQLGGATGRPREWIYCQSDPSYQFERAVRTREWKLLGSGDLYDMTRDPWEEHALRPEGEPEAARRARARLQAVLDSLQGDGSGA